MRYFYDPSSGSENDEEASPPRAEPVRRSNKAKGKQRAVDVDDSPWTLSTGSRDATKRVAFTADGDRSGRIAFSSDSSSSSDNAGGSSSSDEDDEASDTAAADARDVDVLSESDSEEEAYPVGSTLTRSSANRRNRLRPYSNVDDPLEAYTERERKKAWQRAQDKYNKDLMALRVIRLNAFAKAEANKLNEQTDELELVRLVLEDFAFRRAAEEEKIDLEFRERNRRRWSEINDAIAQLEQREAAAKAAQQKQEQAETRARELREAELFKVQQETREKELKLEEEKRKAAQAESRRKAAAEAEAAERQKREDAANSAPKAAIGSVLESRQMFEGWMSKIKVIKSDVLPAVSNNAAWRNACRTLKRGISTRVSNISASAQDIRTKTAEVHGLLNDSKATRETYLWSLNLLSKRVIGMANMNSEADLSPVTYALAQLLIGLLLADHSELADIFMARLVKRCPYVLPYYPLRGQLSMEEHNKLIGRKASEQTVNYNQRMTGIIALYAAICQTSPQAVPSVLPQPTMQHIPAYFRPEGAWRWLASIVRPPLPLLDVTPQLLYNFLRMASERLYQVYTYQFIKLLKALVNQGIDEKKVRWNDAVMGDLSMVRNMLSDWMNSGQITGAGGRAPT